MSHKDANCAKEEREGVRGDVKWIDLVKQWPNGTDEFSAFGTVSMETYSHESLY